MKKTHVIFIILSWPMTINCAQPIAQTSSSMPLSMQPQCNSSNELIEIDFFGVLDEDRPQQLKPSLNKNRADRKKWAKTIQTAASDLNAQWTTILNSKDALKVDAAVQKAFAPINHFIFRYPYKDRANINHTQAAIQQLFVDTCELSQKKMNVVAMLNDAANLPDNDQQLIIDLEQETIKNLVKRDQLFSSPKHRMQMVTKYYLAPIDNPQSPPPASS